jgi:hypothetical protein
MPVLVPQGYFFAGSGFRVLVASQSIKVIVTAPDSKNVLEASLEKSVSAASGLHCQ